ncbi:MAPEG family protein [Maricaulis sp.]|uniref:MAPEG family protein n=1 Tax=Maricaulis sp. TaxID=1486257 RepID=UPI003A8ED5D3
MAAYPFTMLGTLGAVLMTIIFMARVGMARGKTGIKAPAMSGSEEFERANRVHLNTVEQMVLFLPVLWIFATLAGDLYAGIGALVWLIGRVLYSQGYMADPGKRELGFMIGGVALLLMFLGSTGLLVWGLFTG